MRVTLLGTGGSAGVPMIGGADGEGDWGACDPGEARNRRTRSSIIIENTQNQRLLIDYLAGYENAVPGDTNARSGRGAVHPCACGSYHRDRRRAASSTASPTGHWRHSPPKRPWTRLPGGSVTRSHHGTGKVSIGLFLRERWSVPATRYGPSELDLRLFGQGHGRVETLGLRIGPFGYSTDVVQLDDAALETLTGVDTWVVGCFLRHEYHWTHANLPTVLGWVERVRPRRTVLTHMGPDMDWAWLRANLPAGSRARVRWHGAGVRRRRARGERSNLLSAAPPDRAREGGQPNRR